MEDELVERAAAPGLGRHIQRYVGYAERTGAPTRQREPPGTGVVLIFGLGPELRLVDPADLARPPLRLGSCRRPDQARNIYPALQYADAEAAREWLSKAFGAEITPKIEDTFYGSREHTAKDPEGHVWSFGTYWPKKGDPPVT